MNAPILFVNAEEVMTKFEERLKRLEQNLTKNFQPKEPERYYTRKEVVKDIFKIDYSTESRWRKAGKINAYGIGNRVYYLRSEIDEMVKKNKL